jgi:hypothetical protein
LAVTQKNAQITRYSLRGQDEGAWAMLFVLEALIPLRWHEAKMRGFETWVQRSEGRKSGV